MRILSLNGGSSSFKLSLFDFAGPHPEDPAWTVRLERKGPDDSPVSQLEPLLREHCRHVDAVGHRIVHGGKAFTGTARIDAEVKAGIARMAAYAPEHNHLEMQGIEICERVLGSYTPQYAVFDTAFHSTLPEPAYVYPGPYGWLQEGIRRYGFHGISHRYVGRRAAEIVERPLDSLCMVTCHLGNGCSLAAVRNGQCVDTTMGFTPLEGLMMGTRSGSIDPGIIIHLVRHRGYKAEDLDHVLNKESGLKGVSGISGDMREIEAAMEQGNPRARLAFDIFVRRLASGIAAMVPALGRLDLLVFTGGIGENSLAVRDAALRMLEFLGKFLVLVVPTREEWEIAREVSAQLANANSPQPPR